MGLSRASKNLLKKSKGVAKRWQSRNVKTAKAMAGTPEAQAKTRKAIGGAVKSLRAAISGSAAKLKAARAKTLMPIRKKLASPKSYEGHKEIIRGDAPLKKLKVIGKKESKKEKKAYGVFGAKPYRRRSRSSAGSRA